MKKLSKTILSVAAVSAVSAVMAASAMAMSAAYADGKVTLSDVTSTGDSQTLLVLSEDAGTVTEGIIKQIDQKDDKTSFGTVTVGNLADGTYYVRIGGNGSIQTATFTVGTQGGGEETKTKDIVVGDTDGDDGISSNDALQVARKASEWSSRYGNAGKEYRLPDSKEVHVVGDTDGDGTVSSNDALQLARKASEWTSRYGNAGKTIKVVDETVK